MSAIVQHFLSFFKQGKSVDFVNPSMSNSLAFKSLGEFCYISILKKLFLFLFFPPSIFLLSLFTIFPLSVPTFSLACKNLYYRFD